MKKRVFIVYSSEDLVNVKRYFIDVLENDCDVQCVYDGRDFTFGKTTVDNIANAIKTCQKTFVVLTKSSLEKSWVRYEMLLALEKSQRCRRLCLTLFLMGVDRTLVEGQLFGVLSNAMLVPINVNKDNWQERLKQDMLDKLQEDAPMSGINIAANLSVGQAWSHFTGYGRIVLPLLQERITSSKWYQQNPERFPVAEFNLIPDTAQTWRKLTDMAPSRINFVDHLEKIIAGRGSFGDRPYSIPVYSITDQDGEVYYFVGQIPNTLSILNKLEHLDQCEHGRIKPGERSLQVARFYHIYNRLVNHPQAPGCNNMVVLLHYNSEKVDPADLLLKAIKKRLGKHLNATQASPLHPAVEANRCDVDQVPCDCTGAVSECKYDKTVYIDCVDSCIEDAETARDLGEYLVNNGYQVYNDVAGLTHFQNVENAMKKCKWAIFVISKTSIHHKEFELLQFKFRELICQSVEENQVRVIPVADGIQEDDISDDLRAVTYLSKQERDYKGKLLKILQCGDIPMECPVSAQDVSHGLAWAYVLNYLNITLQDRTKHFDQIQAAHPHCKVYRKMFIIIPSSCATRSLGALDCDERGRLLDPNFQQLQDIHYKTENVGGVVNREYQLVTYKITTPNKSYIVAVEYPNAVLCLQEMSELSPLSGLSKDHLPDEAWRFRELVQQIIDMQNRNISSVADRAKLLYYDDSQWTVAEAMLEILQQEKE